MSWIGVWVVALASAPQAAGRAQTEPARDERDAVWQIALRVAATPREGEVIVDRGSRDGLTVGDTVTFVPRNGSEYVGQVREVAEGRATVALAPGAPSLPLGTRGSARIRRREGQGETADATTGRSADRSATAPAQPGGAVASGSTAALEQVAQSSSDAAALDGAHAHASCLRCHNDRGPVADFAARGCSGCHEDVHRGQLQQGCATCHDEWSWRPRGMHELHRQTRFPLTGVHASASCRACHPGAEVGVFAPTPVDCVDCHREDLAAATNPDHFALGYVDRCDRCHVPFVWDRVELGDD